MSTSTRPTGRATGAGPRYRWQAFVAANVRTLSEIRTLAAPTQLGPLALVPCGLVRNEPNVHDLVHSSVWQSSPVNVEGPPEEAPYAPLAGPVAMNQVWRTCALLALDFDAPFWPIAQPMAVSTGGEGERPYDTVERVEPTSATFLCRPEWASVGTAPAQSLLASSTIELATWLNTAWTRLEGDRRLEENARSYLTARRLGSFGHLYVEPVVVALVALFDALGVGKGSRDRIREAMGRSFARHYCPELRSESGKAAEEL